MTEPRSPPYQSLRTLAENLDVAESTVELWVKQGKLPLPYKIGGRNRWDWKEVKKHIAALRGGGAQSADPDNEIERIREATRALSAQH